MLLDQAGKKGREFVDGDDEDDRNSVSSQPPRSPSPKTSGRPSPALVCTVFNLFYFICILFLCLL